MNTKHKWYDVIVAWASGEKIQYKLDSENTWKDYFEDNFTDFNLDQVSWRVKPKTVTKKYRMALVEDGGEIDVVSIDVTDFSDSYFEYTPYSFIRWVCDIVEVEIEV